MIGTITKDSHHNKQFHRPYLNMKLVFQSVCHFYRYHTAAERFVCSCEKERTRSRALVCDYHTNRPLVRWGTRLLVHETTLTEGREDTESPEANHISHPAEHGAGGGGAPDRETGRERERQVECQVLLAAEEKCLFLHLRPSGSLFKSKRER